MIIIKSLRHRRRGCLLFHFLLSLCPYLVAMASHMGKTFSYQYPHLHDDHPVVITSPICTFRILDQSLLLHLLHLDDCLPSRTNLHTLLHLRLPPDPHLCFIWANHWTPSRAHPHPCLYTSAVSMISTFRIWAASTQGTFPPLPLLLLGSCKDLGSPLPPPHRDCVYPHRVCQGRALLVEGRDWLSQMPDS